MKTILRTSWLLALCVVAPMHHSLQADQTQLPVSRVSGLLAVPLPANALTHLGLPFTPEPVTTHLMVTSISRTATSAVLGFAASAGLGDLTTVPHSVVIVSGAQNGVASLISSSTATSITTAVPLPAGIKPNLDRVMVVPNWTLTPGPNSLGLETVLTTNVDADLADKVTVSVNGVLTEYFHDGATWVTGGNPVVGQVVIPLQAGIKIQRVAGSNEDLVLRGVTYSGTQKTVRRPANSLILSNPFLTPFTLGQSSIKDIVAAAPTGSAAADKLKVVQAGAEVEVYNSGSGWKLVTDNSDANSIVVGAGAAFIVEGAPVIEPRTWPRRWRLGRPKRSVRPPVREPSERFWSVLETFTAGS